MSLVFGGLLVVLGVVGAFVAGLIGVGGAIVMIPLLLYVPPLLGVGRFDVKTVAAITMVQVFVAAISGVVAHGRHRAVNPRLAWVGGLTMAVGSLAGAVASKHVPHRVLLIVFALMVTAAFALMFLPEPSADITTPAEAKPYRRRLIMPVTGGVGLAAGLVGAGGAFLLVPVLIAILRVPVRVSIGTSLAMITASALTGFLGKAITGQIPLGPALAVIAGSLTGAPLGAKVSHRAPITVLRVVLGALIAVVSIRVWADVLWH